MWQNRFDTKFIGVLSVMAVLALMVSAAAIAVNSYLVRSHEELAARNVPALELAARALAEAEAFSSLATGFVEAETTSALDELTSSLLQSVDALETDIAKLEKLRVAAGAAPPGATQSPPPPLRDVVTRLAEQAQDILRLEGLLAERAARIMQTGTDMTRLTEAEGDLARLRMTAGITDIYANPSPGLRDRLDALADRHLFAYDRLTELIHAAVRIDLELQHVPSITDLAGVEAAHQRIETAMALLDRRIPYLPTELGRRTAAGFASLQREELGANGVLSLRRQQITLEAEIARGQTMLRTRVAALAERARQTSDAVQRASMDEILRTDRVAKQLSTAFLALAVLVVVIEIMAWLYARRELVGRMASVARNIVSVARGNYDAPIAITGHDEIGRMEKALNILRRRAGEGARLRGHLEEAVLARTQDVVREMDTANAARADAEAANRAKSGFLARMSHEIRTPLNGVIGMLQLLQGEQTDPKEKTRARTALKSAHDLMDITNDILIYASNEDPAARTNPEHFSPRELTEQLGQQLAALAALKNLDTGVDLIEPMPEALFGNMIRIRQVVNNLLSNAVKYTDQGHVSLSVEQFADEETGHPVMSFTVSDTGIGMSPDTLGQAFDHYTRAAEVYRAGIEGTGLGLSIARQLTQAMNGTLDVESEPGVGSRFTLTVPVEMGDAAQVADAPEPAGTRNFGLTVLVIEDHPVNRLVMRGYLERMGCSVRDADTGQRGLLMAQAPDVDVILIDLDLPDMDGSTVATDVTSSGSTAVLAAVTAHSIDDTPEERARLGVSQILAKPVSPRRLANLLADVAAKGPCPKDMDQILAHIQDVMADLGPDVTKQAVDDLMSDIPETITRLETAAGTERRKMAHRLKGAAAHFGLLNLCETLKQIETASDDLDAHLLQHLKTSGTSAVASLAAALEASGLHSSEAGSTKR